LRKGRSKKARRRSEKSIGHHGNKQSLERAAGTNSVHSRRITESEKHRAEAGRIEPLTHSGTEHD